ncbi:hypothetical protein SCB49_12024 [unidentified eubacterium SCB49]|nr:hypothetical protein SCB49_12024 [unidentified eubacterium SCB49]
MKKVIFLLVAIVSVNMAVAQTQVGEVTLPNTMNFNSQELILNGTGIRKKAMVLKLYSGGLYLPVKSSDAKAIISSDDTMSIRLVITSGFVDSEAMSGAVADGFDAATDGNTAPIASQIKTFVSFFSEEIVENDVFDITNQKGKGVVVYKNDKELGVINNATFKEALFGIWLGDDPADSKLKKGLLGK